jgi:hypothetical protein
VRPGQQGAETGQARTIADLVEVQFVEPLLVEAQGAAGAIGEAQQQRGLVVDLYPPATIRVGSLLMGGVQIGQGAAGLGVSQRQVKGPGDRP